MALRDCRECGKQVASNAVACPHCGYVSSAQRVSTAIDRLGCIGFFILAGAAILLWKKFVG